LGSKRRFARAQLLGKRIVDRFIRSVGHPRRLKLLLALLRALPLGVYLRFAGDESRLSFCSRAAGFAQLQAELGFLGLAGGLLNFAGGGELTQTLTQLLLARGQPQ
jgi:hypothetical protein